MLKLFVAAPDHLRAPRQPRILLSSIRGRIFGGVKPAEAINTLKPHLDIDVFRHYRDVFEALPNMLVFGKTLFVHGGIPKDRTLKEKWEDLSTLNDEGIRFEMMWSDPSSAEVIPAALQEQSARFPFGKLQAAAFLKRIGCDSLVRGHEKVNEGFRIHFDDHRLLTMFSAGSWTAAISLNSSYHRHAQGAPHPVIEGIAGHPHRLRTYNDPSATRSSAPDRHRS